MEYLISVLIDLVVALWRGDREIRDGSLLGESEMERSVRRGVAWFCGGIVLLLVAGWVWWRWWRVP